MIKKCVVYKYSKENLGLIDYRMLPPKIVSPKENTSVELVQRDIDSVDISKDKTLSYFTPSIVSIQLNIAKPAILRCKELGLEFKKLSRNQNKLIIKSPHDQLINDSIKIYEYIESAQTAIIFSFTAIETFFNLSIPEDYKYQIKKDKSTEVYSKFQIERYVSWKDKLKIIIPEIYKIKDINSLPFWSDLHELIQIRNDIVHQKSTEDTQIIGELLKANVPKICFSSIQLISHVYNEAFKNKSLPACCARFPVVSKETEVKIFKSVSNLEPILKD